MKAVILAGGRGTRGRPYTDYFPKAMTPVHGRPLIDHIVGHLGRFDFISGIIVVSDFGGLGGQIKNYYRGRHVEKRLSFVQDSQRGTGGDLLPVEGRLGRDRDFVLWFADNLCAVDLKRMREVFREKGGDACIATRTRRREETGFAVVEDGIIREFKEKPTVRLQMHECLGVYMLQRGVIGRIRDVKKKEVNLSYDVLQQLSGEGRVSAFDIGGAGWIDAESPAALERNRGDVKKIIGQMGRPPRPGQPT